MAGVSEENRRRVAGVLCLIGLLLVLVGTALTLKYQSDVEDLRIPARKLPDNKQIAQVLEAVLFCVLLLICMFGVCTLAFLRWSRRFRRYLLARPHPPTPADDVWARHRLPDKTDSRSASPKGQADDHDGQ